MQKLKELVNLWDVGELLSFKKVKKGVVNTNWIIKTSSGKYILRKLGSNKKPSELSFEFKYLDYLNNKKFPYRVPLPIKNKKGKLVVNKGGSYFWIYEFIDGRDIIRFNYPELKECAKMMASYHKLIEKSGLNNNVSCSDFAKEEILEEIKSFRKDIGGSPKDKKEKIFLEESEKLIKLFEGLDVKGYSKLKKYPLHRDINPENTLWVKKKLVGLIDFENVGEIKDALIKDIAGMLQYSCRDRKNKYKLDLKLVKFFLKEYKKYHPLSKNEISFIPSLIIAGAIEDFSYSYWMLLNDPERAKLYRLKLYSKVAQWHNEHKAEMLEKIVC
ncbi:phosphotransferase [Candidatus Woesearchaeota archaeon]|jgi:homoserine kinase type II|nr:phosphotransferase [Candidatus Woesearchaeota archaeon]MBT6045139.1 phosphotransferase [Candidatus Woesearchaeota archaeon]